MRGIPWLVCAAVVAGSLPHCGLASISFGGPPRKSNPKPADTPAATNDTAVANSTTTTNTTTPTTNTTTPPPAPAPADNPPPAVEPPAPVVVTPPPPAVVPANPAPPVTSIGAGGVSAVVNMKGTKLEGLINCFAAYMENAARRPDNSKVEGADPDTILYCKTYPKDAAVEKPHFCRFDGSNVLLDSNFVPEYYWNCQMATCNSWVAPNERQAACVAALVQKMG